MEYSSSSDLEKKKIIVVDVSDDMESEVRDTADANLTASKEELRGIKGFFKKIWKYGLAEEYYRNKEIAKIKKKVLENENLYAGDGADRTAHIQAMDAIVERFASEYEESVHKEAGEKKEILGDSLAEKEVRPQIKGLIKNYASGTLNDAAFQEEKNRIFSQLKGVKKDTIDKGCMFADNLLEIARNVKEAVAHGRKLDDLDLDFDVVVGKAKSGVRTEAQFNAVDRITEKIVSSKIGSFANEATIASAVALAYSIGTFASKRLMGSKLAAWGSFGATAGLATVFSGMRESRRLEEERKHHAREIAKGKKFNPDKSPRRKEMEEFRQETRDANSLVDNLESKLYDFKDGKKELKNITQEEFKKIIADLAEIESRVKISDQQKIDLISFSEAKKVDAERLRMDIVRAQAKVELRKIAKINPDFVPDGKSFDDLLGIAQEARMSQLIEGDGGIEKKNALFKKMKRKKVAQSMAKGLAVGLSIGTLAQEVGAVFQEGREGLWDAKSAFAADGSPSAVQHFTVLEYLRRLAMDDLPKADKLGAMREFLAGGHRINMPEGSDFVPNPDGSFSLTRGATTLVNHVTFNPDGGLSEESKKLLESQGIEAVTFDISPAENKVLSGGQEIIAGKETVGHDGLEMHGVHRTLWYDNDTPKPVFDKNELDLHWGGHHGTGVDSHGNYVFNAKQMANDGSYHGKFSIEAQDAIKGGKLKMLFSLSQDTQNQVVEVPIDVEGNVTIDPDSELGKALFRVAGGRAEFLGKYAEVAEIVGEKDGIDQVRILATHVGHGIEDPSPTPNPIPDKPTPNNPITIFDVPPGEAPDYRVDPMPFVVMPGRDPLEKTEENKGIALVYGENMYGDNIYDAEDIYGYDGYDGDYLENPERGYLEGADGGQENYLENVYGKDTKELSELSEQIPPMSEECKLAINLPAYQEKNIYQTLKEYSTTQLDEKGSKLDPNLFEINVFINRPNKNVPFDDKTIEEAERFKKDHPDYKINVIKKTFDFTDKPVMGKIYKTMADLAVFRNTERVGDKNKRRLILRTGGADAMEKNPYFIKTILEKFEDPKVAVYKSESRLPLEVVKKFPLLHVLYVLQSGLNRLLTRGKSNIGLGSFSAELYSKVGGFNDKIKMAEEVDLARKMRNAIKASSGELVLKKDLVKNAIDDPRRYIWALYNNMGMARAYNKFGNKGAEASLRSTDWIKKVTTEKIPSNLELTKENLEREINLYYKQYLRRIIGSKSSEQGRKRAYNAVNRIFSKMLSIAGLAKGDYEFIENDNPDNASISVKNISKLENLVKNRKFASYKDFA